MGKFLTALHVKTTGKEQFIEKFTRLMKKDGYVPCSEDEAAVSYAAAFSEGGWVTLSNGESTTTELSKTAKKIAEGMDTLCFTAEVVDSDFAILNLFAQNGSENRVIVGDGSGYGIEKAPILVDMWKPLIQSGDESEFVRALGLENTFVEDTLYDIGKILGITPSVMTWCYDEFEEEIGHDENVISLSFRKAVEKKLSLNAAFKQVFGEALEPLGFKLIKSKYPYFVRVVSNEIIHYVTIANERADGRGYNGVIYKCFNVFCGVSTVYNSKIDFDTDPRKLFFGGLDSVHEIYTKSHWYDLDMKYRSSIMEFYYNPTSMADMLKALTRALKVTEDIALPVINPAVTLEKCMDYFGMMEHFIFPDLGDCGDGLFITRWFSADDYVMFCERRSEHEIEHCRHELNSNLNLSPKMKISLEERIKFIMDEREERQKKFYEIYDNPEMHEKAPAELERRKKANTEKLRGYGLEI